MFLCHVPPFPKVTGFQRSVIILALQSTISTFVTFHEHVRSIESFQAFAGTVPSKEISFCSYQLKV